MIGVGAEMWIAAASAFASVAGLIWTVNRNSRKDNQESGEMKATLDAIRKDVSETKTDVKNMREEAQKQQVSVASMARDIKTLYNNDARLEKQVESYMDMAQAVKQLADAVSRKGE